MSIIAFYSVKGGTGRSLSLANVAYLLGQKGKKIGCVDFDIMAPGLLTIFGIPPELSSDRAGVIDLLLELNNYQLFTKAVIDCSNLLNLEPKRLLLIPAKSESAKRYRELAKIKLGDIALMSAFSSFYLRTFRDLNQLDYVFIDARSGFAQESMCALSLAEKYIIFFTRLDPQSQVSTLHFLTLFTETYKRKLKPIVVATNIPAGDSEINFDGQVFKINLQAKKIIDDINQELKNFETRIQCIIPFDEELLLKHKILTENDRDNPTFHGINLLRKIIEEL